MKMTHEDFSEHLHKIVGSMTAASILSNGYVYNILAEELNNEVIESWEQDTLKERIAEASKLGADAGKRYATHDIEEPANPFGCDSEPALHQAWQEEYENAFEANKR